MAFFVDVKVKAAKKKCCVPGCSIKTGSFFGFPNPQQQPLFFKIWLDVVQNPIFNNLEPKEIVKKYRICATHFREEDLQPRGRRGIVWNAIPQCYLPATPDYIKVFLLKDEMAERNRNRSTCILCDRSRINTKVSYFRFPVDIKLKQKWVDFCVAGGVMIPDDINHIKPSTVLCALHFSRDAFRVSHKRLVKGAVPTIAIPSRYTEAPKLEDDEDMDDITVENYGEWDKILQSDLEEDQPEQDMSQQSIRLDASSNSKQSGNLMVTNEGQIQNLNTVKNEFHILKKEEQSDSSVVQTMTNLKFVSHDMYETGNVIDTSVSLSHSNHRCRLCLEMSVPLFAFESVVTFDDGSTLDVYQTFQKITRESDEQIQNKKYPSHLCMSCLKLLVGANNFYEKYQKSLAIIEEVLLQESEKGVEDYLDVPEKVEIVDFKLEHAKNTVEVATTGPVFHKCPICKESFTALELKKHCWEHSTLRSYLRAAPIYNKKVKFYAKPRSTVSIFNVDDPTFTCPFCAEELDTQSYFEHIEEHENLGNFKCQICDRNFVSKNCFFKHQRSHKEQGAYRCRKPGCGKRFFKKESLNYHTAKHTDQEDLPFRCSACSKAFANPQDLKGHILNHENSTRVEKPVFSCSTCRKRFSTRRAFRHHPCYKKRMFGSKSLVLCYVCGQRVLNIQKHMERHAVRSKKKERTYMCSHCGKFFGHMTNLWKHVKCVHTSEANGNYCGYCSKKFKDANELKMHECTNLTERRFVCDLCNKRFTERGYLVRHRKRAHPELFYDEEIKSQ